MLAESDLRPYQHLAIDHLVNVPKCALWAGMGLGKTVSTLTAIDRLRLAGIEEKPTLVIAPLRVAKSVWPEEVRKWRHLSHLKVVPILGSRQQRLDALQERADVYTINFENLEWLIGLLWDRWPFGAIVVDESTKLKSLRASVRRNKQGTEFVAGKGTQRAKSLLKVVYQHKPSRFIELTGTPSPNGLQDLWGQIYFLDYGKRLGNIFDAFRSRWFEQDFTGYGIKPKQHAQVQIETALKDICLSLRSEDWFDLEKPIVENIYVDLPSHVQAEYRRMEKTLLAEIRGERIEAFNAGARTMKCRQLAAGACYTGSPGDPGPRNWLPVHDNKLDALEEIVEEASGQPILVAYDFAFDLERLLKRFPKGRKLDKNPKTIEEWNAGRIPLLFAHPASAGHGLNLQHGSNILVYFTYNWNGEEHSQILERIGPVRQFQAGYKRNVYVYKIVTRGTIDEDVLESLSSKQSIQDILMKNLSRRAR